MHTLRSHKPLDLIFVAHAPCRGQLCPAARIARCVQTRSCELMSIMRCRAQEHARPDSLEASQMLVMGVPAKEPRAYHILSRREHEVLYSCPCFSFFKLCAFSVFGSAACPPRIPGPSRSGSASKRRRTRERRRGSVPRATLDRDQGADAADM